MMENSNRHTVGRAWYVEIIEGTLSSQVFLGTRHPVTGTQVWHRLDWGTSCGQLTEAEILDELWSACISLMEARSDVG